MKITLVLLVSQVLYETGMKGYYINTSEIITIMQIFVIIMVIELFAY